MRSLEVEVDMLVLLEEENRKLRSSADISGLET